METEPERIFFVKTVITTNRNTKITDSINIKRNKNRIRNLHNSLKIEMPNTHNIRIEPIYHNKLSTQYLATFLGLFEALVNGCITLVGC